VKRDRGGDGTELVREDRRRGQENERAENGRSKDHLVNTEREPIRMRESASEPGHCRTRVENRKGRASEPRRVARRDGVASRNDRRRRADGIFEIRPGKKECVPKDLFVHTRGAKDGEQLLDDAAGERRPPSPARQVVGRRESMGRKVPDCGAALDCSPESRGGPGVNGSLQEDVKNDVDIEEKFLQRYFSRR
jgi:hypothetical protein